MIRSAIFRRPHSVVAVLRNPGACSRDAADGILRLWGSCMGKAAR